MVKPKKHLGQHFLTDENIAKSISDLVQPLPNEKIIEIGPGEGVLTKYLAKYPNPVITMDVDEESVSYLKMFQRNENLTHLLQDFLSWKFEEEPVAIAGNLPYNISSQIFFHILENKTQVRRVVAMVQHEVGERLCSAHGNSNYGILSVLLQSHFTCTYQFKVPPQVFNPPPKVHSAVVVLENKNRNQVDDVTLKWVVKQAFLQKRKMLRNTLKFFGEHLPLEYQTLRPEDLGFEDFERLAEIYKSKVKK
jgi:16S rRNA (adenine1518-N6/adenine1519-N6)-dimethyltransferase